MWKLFALPIPTIGVKLLNLGLRTLDSEFRVQSKHSKPDHIATQT